MNRPIKIAYLLPFDDLSCVHMNIDAVIFESYTRWAGVYTLLIPAEPQRFLLDGYDNWLERYDPDFIYSYVELEPGFIEKIDRLCCPIAFLKHAKFDPEDNTVDWRSFIPTWDRYIHPVSSISTVQSPATRPRSFQQPHLSEPTVFTQYGMQPANRFLADNFGTGFSLHRVTHAIPGLFKTMCLVPPDLPPHVVAGTERCFSILEAFQAITDHKATPIARLAMAYSAGIPRPESPGWSSACRLFVGSTPLDRIHFWNARHLGSNWNEFPNALLIEPALFDDDQFVSQLGQYLNKNNFLGSNNGPCHAEFYSYSVEVSILNGMREKLQPHTWNMVRVSQSPDEPMVPSQKNLSHVHEKLTDTSTLRLTEDISEIKANEPAHFAYIPPQFRGIDRGQWIVELEIQRHNNLSKYTNVVDAWILPKRRRIARAFTDRLAKPTLGGRIALVPWSEIRPFSSPSIMNTSSYEVYLPSDEAFFRHLVLDFFIYPSDDLRALAPTAGYREMGVSDKGQNLRGVVSLFDHLATAFEILTNKYWREVLTHAREDAAIPLTFDFSRLSSFIPNDRATIQRLTEELHFTNIGITKKYLGDSLKDTLEHLVRLNVFYQVAHWRCGYCGHSNSRSFDNMKLKNSCDICAAEYLAPIDIEWKYELNNFVYRSLEKHSGMTVLWALGFLQDRLHSGAFWYIPEVDLYESDDDPKSKNEIDILCMRNGMFYAVEAKRSASVFLDEAKAVVKFVKLIDRLRPDVALLVFERYCFEEDKTEATKSRLAEVASGIRQQIGPWTQLEIVVAQDIQGFEEFPSQLGWHGRRVHSYH